MQSFCTDFGGPTTYQALWPWDAAVNGVMDPVQVRSRLARQTVVTKAKRGELAGF